MLSGVADQLGNITQIRDEHAQGQIGSYTYAPLNRLLKANVGGGDLNGPYSEAYIYKLTSGVLSSKAGRAYTYGAKPHAVTARLVDGNARTLIYDGENRLAEVQDASGNPIARYTYDGAGAQVKAEVFATPTPTPTAGPTATPSFEMYDDSVLTAGESDWKPLTQPVDAYNGTYASLRGAGESQLSFTFSGSKLRLKR